MKNKFFLLLLFYAAASFFNIGAEGEKGLKKIKEIKGNEGKRWAICIGINNYEDENIVDLKKAKNDARDMGKILEEKGQFDKVIVLIDDEKNFNENTLPTKAVIEKKIEYILSFSSSDDLIIFSFSGHGISDDKGESYLVARDTNINNKFATSIKVSDIVKKLKQYNIKKSLLIIDACREEISDNKGIDNKSFLTEIFKESEIAATFYSTKAGWFSYEDTESDYGIFTRFMLEGLNGSADLNKDGIVTFSELEVYVQEAVSEFSLKNNKKQKPYTQINGEKYGDLALTAYNEDYINKSIQEKNTVFEVSDFKIALKQNEEYKTALMTWTLPQNANFDKVIILRSSSSISYKPENGKSYIEGEIIKDINVKVVKILDKSIINFTDDTLEPDAAYYYKIFTLSNNKGMPLYSKAGYETVIRTGKNEDTVNIRLDTLKVLEVLEENKSWGAELIWKIEVRSSDGKKILIHERTRDKYKAFVKDTIYNFTNTVEFSLSKKETSFFDIIVEIIELDTDVTDGKVKENQQDDVVINKKYYRYNLTDAKTFQQHTIVEEEKKSCIVELKWTITKVK